MSVSALWDCPKRTEAERAADVQRVVGLSLATNVIGVAVKLSVGMLVGSRALVADAVHSMSDTLSYGLNFADSSAAPNQKLPAAGGSPVLIGSLTFLSGVALAAHNAAQLFRGTQSRPGLLGLVVSVVSILIYGRLYLMARCASRAGDNRAFVCSVQTRTDVLASSLTFLGMLASTLGFLPADSLSAVAIGGLLISSSWAILRSAGAETTAKAAVQISGRLLVTLGALSVATIAWVVQDASNRNHIILVPAQAAAMSSPVDPALGRAPFFVIVDTRTQAATPIANAGISLPGHANDGVTALIATEQVDIVLAAHIGDKLFNDLRAADVRMYYFDKPMTVTQAVTAYSAGELPAATAPNVEQGSGLVSRARWLGRW